MNAADPTWDSAAYARAAALSRHLWGRYRDLALPFEPVNAPTFEMRLMAIDPGFLERASAELAKSWGGGPRDVSFPLTVNCGRKA